MSFKIYVGDIVNSPETVQKTPNLDDYFEGTLKNACDVVNPVIIIESASNSFPYNYAYIPIWGRYYFITKKVINVTGIWEISMHVDVLMTYGKAIDSLSAFVARNQYDYNINLVDSRIPFTSRVHPRYTVFPHTPFDVTPTSGNAGLRYVLTTATTGTPHVTTSGTITEPLQIPNNEFLTTSLVNKSYAMDSTEAAKLINEILNMGSFEALINGNKADGIISMIEYPFDIPLSGLVGYPTSPHVQIFNDKTLSIDGFEMCRNIKANFSFGVIQISGLDFMYREPYTRYQLYLPYMGFVDLSSADIDGGSLGVDYVVDYATGVATAFITVERGVHQRTIIKTVNGQIGINIPITRTNAEDVARNTINSISQIATSGVGLALSAASGNPAGIVGSVTGLVNAGVGLAANPLIMRGEIGNSQTSFYAPQYAMMYTLTQECAISPLYEFAAYEGRPYMAEKTISTIWGYTEISKIHLEEIYLDNDEQPTKDELDELEALLKKGVVFGAPPHYPL